MLLRDICGLKAVTHSDLRQFNEGNVNNYMTLKWHINWHLTKYPVDYGKWNYLIFKIYIKLTMLKLHLYKHANKIKKWYIIKLQNGLKCLSTTLIKLCKESMQKQIDQNIFLSNALAASLWHHAVILLLKIDILSDRLMLIGRTFHNFAPKYLNDLNPNLKVLNFGWISRLESRRW